MADSDLPYGGLAQAVLARALLARGDLEGAKVALGQARAALGDVDERTALLSLDLTTALIAAAEARDVKVALPAIASVEKDADRIGMGFYSVEAKLARAEAWAAWGDAEGARVAARALAAAAKPAGLVLHSQRAEVLLASRR